MIVDGLGQPLAGLEPGDELPPRPDPQFGKQPGPYSRSQLRDVTGTVSNPLGQEAENGWQLRNPRFGQNFAHPELRSTLEELGGFDPRVWIRQPAATDWPLTGVITRLGLGAGGTVDLAPFPGTYIIDYLKLAPNFDGIPRHPWAMKIKEQLPEGSRLILSFFEYQHQAKKKLWVISDLWHLGVLDQFDAILIPNQIAFTNAPTPALLQGERMDQTLISEGTPYDPRGKADQTRAIIPSVAWGYQESSLRRQIELLVSQQSVNMICIDAHGPGHDRTLWTWRWLFALEKYAAQHPQIRWIITGITQGWAIRELRRFMPENSFHLVLPLSAYIHAQGASADPELQAEHLRRAVNRLERFRTGKDVAVAKKRPERWPTTEDTYLGMNGS